MSHPSTSLCTALFALRQHACPLAPHDMCIFLGQPWCKGPCRISATSTASRTKTQGRSTLTDTTSCPDVHLACTLGKRKAAAVGSTENAVHQGLPGTGAATRETASRSFKRLSPKQAAASLPAPQRVAIGVGWSPKRASQAGTTRPCASNDRAASARAHAGCRHVTALSRL